MGHKALEICFGRILTLKATFTTEVAFVANVDQDQTAQNVQPDS